MSRSVYVSPGELPERMYRRGRPVQPRFDLDEFLYLRYGSDDFVEGQLAPAAVHFPKQSVNRSSLSEPEAVLFHPEGRYNGLGAVEFQVGDIPETITPEQGATYIFFMRHEPHEENYAHSEIWSDQTPGTGAYREPSKSVKLKFRIQLCRRIRTERIRIPATRNR